ncbi:MAG: rod shape-determining protein RodA, partial [Rubrivivax sp.]
MNAVVQRPSPWHLAVGLVRGFDPPLMLAIALLAAIGLVTMYSAGFDHGTRFVDHARNLGIGLAVALVV